MESKIIKKCIFATNSNDLVLLGGRKGSKWRFWSTRNSFFATNSNDLELLEVKMESKNIKKCIFATNSNDLELLEVEMESISIQNSFEQQMTSIWISWRHNRTKIHPNGTCHPKILLRGRPSHQKVRNMFLTNRLKYFSKCPSM